MRKVWKLKSKDKQSNFVLSWELIDIEALNL